MSSGWERVGEQIGYGLAAIILGPHAALERRARRAMRSSLLDFCRGLQPVKLDARRGLIRRSARLPGTAGSLAIDIELDLDDRTARIAMPIERLPGYVTARITKFPHALFPGMRVRIVSNPRALAGPFRVETESLDDDAATALVETIAAGPLDRVEALALTLAPDQIDLHVRAPSTSEGWASIGTGLTGIVAWLTARWPPSYR